MDKEVVALLQCRQLTVNGKLVVVLAERAGHIVGFLAGRVLLAQDGDVMVCPVHRRTHQVDGAGIHTGIVLVGLLEVDHLGHQRAVGCQHEAAQLCEDPDLVQSVGLQDLVIYLVHALADDHDVIRGLLRLVGHADTAGQVNEVELDTALLLDSDGQLEELLCQCRIIVVGDGIGRQEGMDTEMLHALGLQDPVALQNLFCGHAVLGILGIVHDGVGDLEVSARVIAKAHGLREVSQGLLQLGDVGKVIQVNDGAQLLRQLVLGKRRIIGGEHDLLSTEAAGLGHFQLCTGRAVGTAALLLQNLQNAGIRCCLNGEILTEALIPGKGLVKAARILPDAPLVIEIEGCGVALCDALHLLQCDIRFFHRFSS